MKKRLKIKRTRAFNLLQAKKFFIQSKLEDSVKEKIIGQIDQVNYIDKLLLGLTYEENDYSTKIYKMYKNLLKQYKADLLKTLSLHYNK